MRLRTRGSCAPACRVATACRVTTLRGVLRPELVKAKHGTCAFDHSTWAQHGGRPAWADGPQPAPAGKPGAGYTHLSQRGLELAQRLAGLGPIPDPRMVGRPDAGCRSRALNQLGGGGRDEGVSGPVLLEGERGPAVACLKPARWVSRLRKGSRLLPAGDRCLVKACS